MSCLLSSGLLLGLKVNFFLLELKKRRKKNKEWITNNKRMKDLSRMFWGRCGFDNLGLAVVIEQVTMLCFVLNVFEECCLAPVGQGMVIVILV